MNYQSKICIIGNAGSGKSTLAKKINSETNYSILDLDHVAWIRGRLALRRELSDSLVDIQKFISTHESWIIEGCYGDMIESTLIYKPTLLFLDPGEEKCLEHCKIRPWESHKYKSKEDQDKMLGFLLSWVSEYYRREGPMSYKFHKQLFENYDGPKEWLKET